MKKESSLHSSAQQADEPQNLCLQGEENSFVF